MTLPEAVLPKLMKKIITDDGGHWLWQGTFCRSSYPRFRFQDGDVKIDTGVHRILWEQWIGPLPDWAKLRSACGKGSCVNPKHRRISAT